MQYRMLGNTGLKVSTISMGCEGFLAKNAVDMMNDVQYLMEQGINFIDMYSPNPEFRENFGKAIAGRRDKMILQSHVCAVFQNGQYLRTRNIEQVKAGRAHSSYWAEQPQSGSGDGCCKIWSNRSSFVFH